MSSKEFWDVLLGMSKGGLVLIKEVMEAFERESHHYCWANRKGESPGCSYEMKEENGMRQGRKHNMHLILSPSFFFKP